MDIITYSNQLQERLRQELETIRLTRSDSVQTIAAMMRITESILLELKEFINKYSFNDIREEIAFFKEQKPVLVSQYIYHKKLFSTVLRDAYLSTDQRQVYYYTLLNRMDKYAQKHKVFFYYCMSGDTSRDQEYFTRQKKSVSLFVDKTFSTGYDNVLAIMLAHELGRQYLHDAIRKLSSAATFDSRLNWTGNKTDLIELLYALHASGSINNSEAEVKQIALALEEVFHVKLGNYYDYLKKIAMRKKSQVPFMDTLRERLLRRLSELDM